MLSPVEGKFEVGLSNGSGRYAKKHPRLSLVSIQIMNQLQDLLRKPSPLPGCIWEATWRLISAGLSFLYDGEHIRFFVTTSQTNCQHYMTR
jgi:hypothetical protein